MKRYLQLLILGCLALASCTNKEAQIITTVDEIAHGEWQCFHKEFTLLCPKDAELRIAADTKYWLWVNGELVIREGGLKRGPTPTDSYCDVIREVPNLKFGNNEVVVLVQYYGHNNFSHRITTTPGLYFELRSPLDNILSDESWKAIRYEAMYSAPNEHNLQGFRKYRLAGANVGYDARKALDLSKRLDTENWSSAVVVERGQSEWGEFVERPIPFWRWSELRDYEGTEQRGEELVCKLPYNAHITPYIKLRAKGGEQIKICTDDYWIGAARSFYTIYTAREGEQEFETPIWTNGHEVLYTIPEGVEVLDVKYRESGYDADFIGSFECDDDFCNKLWKKAQRTLYVTMRDTYMDCPDRERAQWWGDVVIELGQAGYVFDERAHLLTRKAILELMMHQREDGVIYAPIPGWYKKELPCQMLASVGYYGFYTYYLQSGDLATIEAVYDRVKRYIFDVWNPSNKDVVNMREGGWHWGDWGTNIDKEALQQCWYGLALKGFAELARITNHKTDMIYALESYDKMTHAFNVIYWNEKLQQYRSDSYTDAPDDRVQAMAVLAGFVPEERYEVIRKFLKKHYNSSPYMEKYAIEALCKMGYYEDALQRMELRFGEMVASHHTTLWEGWEYTGGRGMKYKSGHGTYNHAWSGGGLTILSEHIAGIAPIEPCFKRFSVEPNLASLNHIKSIVPTPDGNIDLYAVKGDKALVIDLVVPNNTEAEVRLPKGYKELKSGEQSGSVIVLAAGKHRVVAR